MSLILEALRKSEAERRRDRAPDLRLELPPVPRRRAPAARPLLSLGAIALAVLALALWLALRGRAPVVASTPPATAPAARPAAETPPLATPLPQVVARPAPASTTIPIAATPAAPIAAARPSPPSPPPVAPPPPAPASTPASAPDAIPDIASTGLPPVKLSMHMWDADPARRFVILDGQRMGEGDRFGPLTVVAIGRKGVVIERDGQRARIPLP